jgi:plasmid stabilization system protein ParE
MLAALSGHSSAAAKRKKFEILVVARKHVVRLAANFERNLADIERFLTEAEAPQAYDALLDELLDTVIPNLERFPGIGRPFLAHPARSVEAANALEALRTKLSALTPDVDALREYIIEHYLVLYAQVGENVYLLAIRHHRQLSFDLQSHWGGTSSLP